MTPSTENFTALESQFHQRLASTYVKGKNQSLADDPDKDDALFGHAANAYGNPSQIRVEAFGDKMVTSGRMDELDFDIWMEDERDICVHVLPVGDAMTFLNFHEIARKQIDRVFAKVFGRVVRDANVQPMCDFYGFREGSRVSRKSDPSRMGMDLFSIRMINLWGRPLAAEMVIEALKLFDDILTGRHRPLE